MSACLISALAFSSGDGRLSGDATLGPGEGRVTLLPAPSLLLLRASCKQAGAGECEMLACRDVSEIVTDYLERSMPVRLRVAVRWHLARCGACRNYVDQMRKIATLLRRSAGRSLAPELAERLVKRPASGALPDSKES
jgi:hypothetical protein